MLEADITRMKVSKEINIADPRGAFAKWKIVNDYVSSGYQAHDLADVAVMVWGSQINREILFWISRESKAMCKIVCLVKWQFLKYFFTKKRF